MEDQKSVRNRSLLHRIRDGVILLLSVSGIAYLYRAYCKRQGSLTRIVVFHDVPDSVWFESMIKTLTDTFHMLSPEDFHTGVRHPSKINVLVTFDDGYQSWTDVAIPMLSKYNVQALFFINSGLVDSESDQSAVDTYMREQLRITPKSALAWEGVGKLVAGGHTVGGHSRSHFDLTKLDSETLREEISTDKAIFEEKTGRAIVDFAYPFGTRNHVNGESVVMVRDSGYTHAYTAMSAFVTKENIQQFRIPRMCIESDSSPTQLKRWVRGSYDLFIIMK